MLFVDVCGTEVLEVPEVPEAEMAVGGAADVPEEEVADVPAPPQPVSSANMNTAQPTARIDTARIPSTPHLRVLDPHRCPARPARTFGAVGSRYATGVPIEKHLINHEVECIPRESPQPGSTGVSAPADGMLM